MPASSLLPPASRIRRLDPPVVEKKVPGGNGVDEEDVLNTKAYAQDGAEDDSDSEEGVGQGHDKCADPPKY